MMPIVDAHLDLGANFTAGRDLRLPSAAIRMHENAQVGQCMVSLPDLRVGGIAVVFAALFVPPTAVLSGQLPAFVARDNATARAQLAEVLRWEEEGLVRVLRSSAGLAAHLERWGDDRIPGLVITLEGSEVLESPDEIEWWYAQGLRAIGPAWGPTRYCGGFSNLVGAPGGFTPLGRELHAAVTERGLIVDLAHASRELMDEVLTLTPRGKVALTHTVPQCVGELPRLPNARVMREIADHGGVVGLVLINELLCNSWRQGDPPVPLQRAADILEFMADAAGWEHLGIGSDISVGDIGLDETPLELQTIADLSRLGPLLPRRAAQGVLGENWLRFLSVALP
jgi:membrane dipeptidase